jgi:hypothetical protein
MRTAWMTAAAAMAGVVVGLLIGRDGGEAVAPVAGDAVVAVPAMPRDTVQAFTIEDVRRVVREELDARAAASGRAAGAAATATTQPAGPDAAQSAAALRASSMLDAAVARRSWTEADSESLRDDFASMAPEQQSEFLRQFAVAVNQGRLVPETERSPF